MRLIITMIFLFTLAALSGCAYMGMRAVQPDRTYVGIEYENLYQHYESVLKAFGYGVDKRNYARGYISSTLKEYDGEKKGLATWREQRKYVAWFDIDRGNSLRHFLILEVVLKEKAPLSFEWRDKKIERASDNEYQQIMAKFDALIVKNGGKLQ